MDKYRGLIFHDALIPGVMAGTVGLTSRVMKPQPPEGTTGIARAIAPGEEPLWRYLIYRDLDCVGTLFAPFHVGEKRYVKLNYWLYHPTTGNPENSQIWDEFTRTIRWPSGEVIECATPDLHPRYAGLGSYGWQRRSSLFMPRRYARTWIEFTAVRPAQCQDITEEEAEASGITDAWLVANHSGPPRVKEYAYLWDALNAKRGFPWSANPWTWRVTFKLCEAPK